MSNAKYKFVGSHPEDLHDGRILAPGDFIHLSDEEVREPHNERLFADGKLIGTGSVSSKEEDLAARRAARREQEGGS